MYRIETLGDIAAATANVDFDFNSESLTITDYKTGHPEDILVAGSELLASLDAQPSNDAVLDLQVQCQLHVCQFAIELAITDIQELGVLPALLEPLQILLDAVVIARNINLPAVASLVHRQIDVISPSSEYWESIASMPPVVAVAELRRMFALWRLAVSVDDGYVNGHQFSDYMIRLARVFDLFSMILRPAVASNPPPTHRVVAEAHTDLAPELQAAVGVPPTTEQETSPPEQAMSERDAELAS